MVDLIRAHQERLLEEIWYSLGGRAPAGSVRDAFFAVPRHLFVERYCTLAAPGFREITEQNLVEHLPALYSNSALGIHYDPGDPRVSTISAPWIVLEMLELLGLSPGQRVFELGTGSGWNAALIEHMVAPGGSVDTVEILPGLVESARRGLQRAGIHNVHVLLGDGSTGPPETGEPFDRAVFTAGAADLPASLYARVREGGRLLFVLAIPGGGNVLIVFERAGGGFTSVATRRCTFVPITGHGSAAAPPGVTLDSLPDWANLSRHRIEHRSFSMACSGPTPVQDRSVDLRSYLWLADPGFRALADAQGRPCFGIYHDAPASLAVIRDGRWQVFGSPEAGERLRYHLHTWVDLGMPGIADLEITAIPAGHPEGTVAKPHWRVACPSTTFLLSLPSSDWLSRNSE